MIWSLPAPFFDHIAADVLERLESRIFVAHNARFDWGWVSRQLTEAVGEVPNVERLCTVQMARRLLPRLRRRNLDAVCAALRDRRRGSPPGPRRMHWLPRVF